MHWIRCFKQIIFSRSGGSEHVGAEALQDWQPDTARLGLSSRRLCVPAEGIAVDADDQIIQTALNSIEASRVEVAINVVGAMLQAMVARLRTKYILVSSDAWPK